MSSVLVTGATGFIGRHLIEQLTADKGITVLAGVRRQTRSQDQAGRYKSVVIDLDEPNNIDCAALQGISCIVHLAAQVHLLHPNGRELASYTLRNAAATERLARAATKCGVRRFVFVSSVKVIGEQTNDRPFRSSDPPAPSDAYGRSKLAAEQALWRVASETGLEVAVVRPPLVYGPGVRANFLRLMRWVDRGRPLPLGAVENRRSLVNVWSLCDLLVNLLDNPAAPSRIWMVSDGDDLSTPELIRRIGRAMGRRVRLPSVPVGLLRLGGALTGRRAEVARLVGSLAVDITDTRRELRWSPPVTVDEGLARTVSWYLSEGRQHGA